MRIAAGYQVVCGIVAAFAALTAASAQPRPMTARDIIDLRRIEEGVISPEGARFLVEVSQSDWKRNRRERQLWLIEASDGSARQMTRAATANAEGAAWAPDGKSFVFLAKRAGDEHDQLYLMSLEGGDARRLTTQPGAVRSPQFSADGSYVYFLSDDQDKRAMAGKKTPASNRDEIPLFDHPPTRRHLWRVPLKEGKAEQLTRGEFVVTQFDLAEDGRTIAFGRAPSALLEDERNAELYVVRLGQAPQRLTDNNYEERRVRWAPDGRALLFLADAVGDSYATVNQNLFRLRIDGGRPEEIASGLPYEITEALWSADGRAIYFSATTGVRSELFSVDLRAMDRADRLAGGDSAARSLSLSRRGLLGFLQSSATSPGEMMIIDPRRPKVHQVSRMHADLSDRFHLPRQEVVQWTAPDGQRVEGLLTYPVPYIRGQRYPLIAQIHGGPRTADVFGMWKTSRFEPLLAAHGYAVLATNYRGGVGYGDEFLQGMNGGYFRKAHTDVLSGVDHVIELGIADPQRLGVMGWSAGGHMTNKLVTLTDRFKAAASGAGASDWPTMALQSDIRWHRADWFGSPPYGAEVDWPLYDETSPLRQAHKVKTPTLILVGAQDERVPAVQSIVFFRALKALGVTTELYVAPDEPHNFRKLRHQLFQINVQLDWFAKHLRGSSYTWEEPPRGADEPPAKPEYDPTSSS